jgi:hypothetical protein
MEICKRGRSHWHWATVSQTELSVNELTGLLRAAQKYLFSSQFQLILHTSFGICLAKNVFYLNIRELKIRQVLLIPLE